MLASHRRVQIVLRNGEVHTLYGTHAVDAVYLCQPSLLEGSRFRWVKGAWALHNLVGHPLMQLLSFAGFHKAAFWVHDNTIPKPVYAEEPW